MLLGASLDTGNLGVSALAASALFLIKLHWPEAKVCILGGREFKTDRLEIDGRPVEIETYPVRYCRNLLIKNHIWKILVAVALKQIFYFQAPKIQGKYQTTHCLSSVDDYKSTLQTLINADLICDITGGDSFSDIYGMGRFVRGYLLKRICQMTGKPFVMLPQTYGPFKSLLAKWMAKRILQKTHSIYSRDKEGLKVIESLIGKSEKIKLCPDVAFTLGTKAPVTSNQLLLAVIRGIEKKNHVPKEDILQLIGLNVSGLLYHGGYTGKNEFGIKDDYKQLVRSIIDYFFSMEQTKILLVPHVVPEAWEAENDLIACRRLKESLPVAIQDRVVIAESEPGLPFYDQYEIKYLIGCCSFFLGSRMHATIAAISQCIPTIGLAYSKKFAGVYEIAGVENCVADLRMLRNEDIMSIIRMNYNNMGLIKEQLKKMIPDIKKRVHSIFDGI